MSAFVLSDGSTLEMPLPCIVCGVALEDALPGEGEVTNQPHAGTSFTTHGHYGSTVFDPMDDSESLTITVCDPCLRRRAGEGYVINTVVTPQRPKRKVRRWDATAETG